MDYIPAKLSCPRAQSNTQDSCAASPWTFTCYESGSVLVALLLLHLGDLVIAALLIGLCSPNSREEVPCLTLTPGWCRVASSERGTITQMNKAIARYTYILYKHKNKKEARSRGV